MVASVAFPNLPLPAPADSERARRLALSREEALLDAGLVRRCNGGDERAFPEIMDRHRRKIVALALSIVRNRADADEIAQDTFIRAYRKLDSFRGDCALSTWLHQIALNLARNRYWHNARRSRLTARSLDSSLSRDSLATLASLIPCNARSPAREAEGGELSDFIARCMDLLAPSRREALAQHNTLDRTYGEIARTLGLNVATVRSRVARARRSFRLHFCKMCPDYASGLSGQ
jgi:RNA polymerase sigma-70 factor (ECF subfamily)